MNLKTFEAKLTQYFQEELKLFFPKDIFKICSSPSELLDYVSKIKEVLRLKENDRNDIQIETNLNLYRKSIPGYIYLFNFIMNRVPTDIYRIRNPKLEIERDGNELAFNREVFSIK